MGGRSWLGPDSGPHGVIVHVSAGLRPVCDSRGPRPSGRPVPAPQTGAGSACGAGARGRQCGKRGARGLGPVNTAWVPHTHTDVACLTHTQPRAGARGPGSAWHPSPGCRFHLLPPRGDVVLRLPPTLGGVLQPAALVPPVAPATALFRLQLPCHTRLAVHPARGLSVTTAWIPAPCGLAAGRPSSGHEGKHHLF